MTVKGVDFLLTVGMADGAIQSFTYKDKELVASPLVPNSGVCPSIMTAATVCLDATVCGKTRGPSGW